MIDYTIDEPHRLIRIRISGWTSTDVHLIRAFSKLLRDPGFDPAFNTLFLFSKETFLSTLLIQHQTNKLFGGMAAHQEGSKWAFVVSNQTTLALLRDALEALDLKSVELQLFDNEASGLQWLNSNEDSPVDSAE